MFRKSTAAGLVLSAVTATLAMALLGGTAQADDRRGDGDRCDTPWIAADGDTPWRGFTFDDDTPWRRSHPGFGQPGNGGSKRCDDTPWR